VGIMLGFPTASRSWEWRVLRLLAYHSVDSGDPADRRCSTCSWQRTYGVMSNDVLIAIPLFLFMAISSSVAADRQVVQEPASRERAVPGALAVGHHRHLRDLATRPASSARW